MTIVRSWRWNTSGLLPVLVIASAPVYFLSADVRRYHCKSICIFRRERRAVSCYCSCASVVVNLVFIGCDRSSWRWHLLFEEATWHSVSLHNCNWFSLFPSGFSFPMTELSVCCHQSFVGRINHSFDARHCFVYFCQWLTQNTTFFISKYARHKHNTISYFRKPWFSLWVKLEFDFLLYQLSELSPLMFFLVSSCKLNRLSKKQVNFGHYLINIKTNKAQT